MILISNINTGFVWIVIIKYQKNWNRYQKTTAKYRHYTKGSLNTNQV